MKLRKIKFQQISGKSQSYTLMDKKNVKLLRLLREKISSDQYLKGCVSTGRGCVEKLWSCYIGSDGICEYEEKLEFVKMDYSIQLRIAKNIKLVKLLQQNHEQLLCKIFQVIREIKILVCDQQVQKGCVKEQMIINSKHVADEQLQKISKLSSTMESDGKCKGCTDGKCQKRTCQDAPSTYNTDYECKNFQSGCVTNSNGCIIQKSFQLTLTAEFQWNQCCVDSIKSSNFNTQFICENNSAIKYSFVDGILLIITQNVYERIILINIYSALIQLGLSMILIEHVYKQCQIVSTALMNVQTDRAIVRYSIEI
ncbi:unnamed protein product [Paramecium pentaurelia]|uniref:Uncharacterized protein n=1 Tax=Paramecium pentaurelia TaxID=43138 RepID=A0A8S1VHQ4_9CILI|nr:unnamed protein product [Paramecium pentaurelia]